MKAKLANKTMTNPKTVEHPRRATASHWLLPLAIAATALAANATTYYWKKGATQALWDEYDSDSGTYVNWSTVGVDGAESMSLPTSSDEIYGFSDCNMILGGINRTIRNYKTDGNYDTAYTLTIENGTLEITGEMRRFRGSIDINNNATLLFPAGSTVYTGVYQGITEARRFPINVNNGGALDIRGTARFYNTKYFVADGGTLSFAPSTLRVSCEANACVSGIENQGVLNLANGLTMTTFDSASVMAGASFSIWQVAGVMNLGGPVSLGNQNGVFNVAFSGGTVNVTGNASFDVTSVTLENSVTFNVSDGKTIDLSPVAFASGSSITKTGAGSVKLPASAPNATISAGSVLIDNGTYDLTNVSFAEGSGVKLGALGGRIDSPGASIANATFSATIPGTSGTVVFYSADATLLAKAKSDLDASVPSGFQLVVNGEALEVASQTGATFTITGNITEGAGWGGSVPEAGEDVAISGNGVVATLPSGASFPAWNSIEVKDGATLRIAADVASLLPIVLNKNATLEIASGATVTLGNAANISGVVAVSGDVITIPTLSIASGATLNVPGGVKFSNVGILLEGTIATATSGGITFGYADSGATAYIGFTANGGTVSVTEGSGSTYDIDPIEFCCPASGSRVVAVGDLTLNNAILPRTSGYTYMQGRMIGLHIGRNNPDDQAFKLVFDNTQWGTSGKLYICGGATFCLTNSSSFITYEHHTQWDRYAEISGNGQLYVGEGCEFRLNAFGNWGDRSLVVNSTSVGHQAVIVENGGIFETYRWLEMAMACFRRPTVSIGFLNLT